ncbi:hypothetical protein IQ06DRAFT_141515 [Phaeosphaeriaceae sp. SRC1lsM3a]|nr:hypothetical protein IQ06DRAFT_141515 [Stagonospora sp. SRC1lsM3a]
MHISFPSPSATVDAKHHHTSSALPSDVSTSDQSDLPSHRSLSYLNRDSVIALGTIPILILAAAGYCILLRNKERQRADREDEGERARRVSAGTCRSYGSRSRAQEATFQERLWSGAMSRGPISTLCGTVSAMPKKDSSSSWSRASSSVSSSTTTGVGSSTDIPLPDACAWRHYCTSDAKSRCPSPDSQYRARAPSTRSHHHRRLTIHDMPDPMLADLNLRHSSTHRRQEKRSGVGVARRGSKTHADQRFSVLEPIAKPGGGIEFPVRAMSYEAEGRRSNYRMASVSKCM